MNPREIVIGDVHGCLEGVRQVAPHDGRRGRMKRINSIAPWTLQIRALRSVCDKANAVYSYRAAPIVTYVSRSKMHIVELRTRAVQWRP